MSSSPQASQSVPSSNTSNDETKAASAAGAKKSLRDKLVASWSKTGITWRVYKAMFKGALAPTICVAIYQADSFAQTFSSIGYLIAIVSILSICFRPRATYLQSLLLNLLFVCTTAGLVVLALYTIVTARANNPEPQNAGDPTSGVAAAQVITSPYNSSAAAIAGLWLFVLVYVLATIRGSNRKYMIPAIMGSIMANVSMVYGAQLGTITVALAYIRTFLSAFLVGLAVATGVSLFVFPSTNRTVIFEDTFKYIAALRAALNANIAYVHSLEHVDMFTVKRTITSRHREQRSSEVQTLKTSIRALTSIATKFQTDLPFAKREIAVGSMGPDDLQCLARRLRMIDIPLVGLSCLSDMFERAGKSRGWDKDDNNDGIGQDAKEMKLQAIEEWHSLMRLVKEPFQKMSDTIEEGLEYVLVKLKLTPPKPHGDPESGKDTVNTSSTAFLEQFVKKMRALHDRRTDMLIGWCKVHGVDLSADYFTNPHAQNKKLQELMDTQAHTADARVMRRQLYVLLYMEFLMWSIGRRTEDLISFVDGLKVSGKLDKTRLIVPGSKRMRKWLLSTFRPEDNGHDDQSIEEVESMPSVKLGEAYRQRRDPMHLPPVNAWERFGNSLRQVASFLRSPQSVFGFRVACATMSIAIVAFLKNTQAFYTRERLFWAQIMVAIGMQPTASDSVKTSLLRIFGTAVFMVIALINWYIADGIPGAIIPIYFLVLHIGPWIIVTRPKFTTLGMIGPITITLIVGYELQASKIGQVAAEASGQEYYPPYLLGPIRLAEVVGGLFLGWLWTIFPFPITEHQEQKNGLGRALYLLAQYYSVMQETVKTRLRGLDTDVAVFGPIAGVLEKSRRKIYTKCNALIAGLRSRTELLDFDVPFGGKFPRKKYEEITEVLQSMLNFMVLITYSSTTFNDLKDANEASSSHSEWQKAFRHLVSNTQNTSQNVTTLLTLLASSVSNSEPLPPYLEVPEPFRMSEQLDKLDSDILSVRHVAEPGYSSFAVTQLALRFLHDDLEVLLPAVKDLVGELDFSLNIERPSNDDDSTQAEKI